MQPSLYINLCEDRLVTSNADGSPQKVIITPKRLWSLGLNLADFVGGLRIKNLPNNGGVTLKWQWSLDGKSWKTGATVITEKTADDDYTGIANAPLEMMPFVRLLLEIRDTTGVSQKTADISVWGYYRYRV